MAWTNWPNDLGSAKLRPALIPGLSSQMGTHGRFPDDREVSHQVAGNLRQPLPQPAGQRVRRAHLGQGVQHQAVTELPRSTTRRALELETRVTSASSASSVSTGFIAAGSAAWEFRARLLERLMLAANLLEPGVMRILAVGRRALALPDDFLQRFHRCFHAGDFEQARQRKLGGTELRFAVPDEQPSSPSCSRQAPNGLRDAVIKVPLGAVIARGRRQQVGADNALIVRFVGETLAILEPRCPRDAR